MHPFLWIIWVFCTGFNQEIQIYTVMGTRRGKSICCKVEYNDYRRAQCRRCWEGRAFLYLSRLVSNMFPWLQESCGGGEPDAEQTKRISSPREKTRLWGWITTDGASAIGVKQRQNADDDSANVWRRGSRCHDQQSVSFWLMQKKKKKLHCKHLLSIDNQLFYRHKFWVITNSFWWGSCSTWLWGRINNGKQMREVWESDEAPVS